MKLELDAPKYLTLTCPLQIQGLELNSYLSLKSYSVS